MQRKESLLLISYAVPLYRDMFVLFSSKRFSISLSEVPFFKSSSLEAFDGSFHMKRD